MFPGPNYYHTSKAVTLVTQKSKRVKFCRSRRSLVLAILAIRHLRMYVSAPSFMPACHFDELSLANFFHMTGGMANCSRCSATQHCRRVVGNPRLLLSPARYSSSVILRNRPSPLRAMCPANDKLCFRTVGSCLGRLGLVCGSWWGSSSVERGGIVAGKCGVFPHGLS